MRITIIGILLLFMFGCNTKYGYIDTGISNGKHDCSMLEYFKGDSYNWDTLVRMIERVDVVSLFEGKEEGYEEFTFFGPTNHAIRNWMLDNGYLTVAEIPFETCKEMVLRHVVKGRYMMKDVPRGSFASAGSSERKGGIELETYTGGKIWLYTVSSPAHGVEDAGPLTLNCLSLTSLTSIPLACPDIQTQTGIVISLDYNYVLDDF